MEFEKPEYFQLRPEQEQAYGYSHALKIGNDIKISSEIMAWSTGIGPSRIHDRN